MEDPHCGYQPKKIGKKKQHCYGRPGANPSWQLPPYYEINCNMIVSSVPWIDHGTDGWKASFHPDVLYYIRLWGASQSYIYIYIYITMSHFA
jgi:hypothetical protein